MHIHRLRRSRILITNLLLVSLTFLILAPLGCGAKQTNGSGTAPPRKVRLVGRDRPLTNSATIT